LISPIVAVAESSIPVAMGGFLAGGFGREAYG